MLKLETKQKWVFNRLCHIWSLSWKTRLNLCLLKFICKIASCKGIIYLKGQRLRYIVLHSFQNSNRYIEWATRLSSIYITYKIPDHVRWQRIKRKILEIKLPLMPSRMPLPAAMNRIIYTWHCVIYWPCFRAIKVFTILVNEDRKHYKHKKTYPNGWQFRLKLPLNFGWKKIVLTMRFALLLLASYSLEIYFLLTTKGSYFRGIKNHTVKKHTFNFCEC